MVAHMFAMKQNPIFKIQNAKNRVQRCFAGIELKVQEKFIDAGN